MDREAFRCARPRDGTRARPVRHEGPNGPLMPYAWSLGDSASYSTQKLPMMQPLPTGKIWKQKVRPEVCPPTHVPLTHCQQWPASASLGIAASATSGAVAKKPARTIALRNLFTILPFLL